MIACQNRDLDDRKTYYIVRLAWNARPVCQRALMFQSLK